jgi:hypothetical protein
VTKLSMSKTAARNGAALLDQARLPPPAGVHRMTQRSSAAPLDVPGSRSVDSPRICLAHISSSHSPSSLPGFVFQRYVRRAGL